MHRATAEVPHKHRLNGPKLNFCDTRCQAALFLLAKVLEAFAEIRSQVKGDQFLIHKLVTLTSEKNIKPLLRGEASH